LRPRKNECTTHSSILTHLFQKDGIRLSFKYHQRALQQELVIMFILSCFLTFVVVLFEFQVMPGPYNPTYQTPSLAAGATGKAVAELQLTGRPFQKTLVVDFSGTCEGPVPEGIHTIYFGM
jgi:hypothetical protein